MNVEPTALPPAAAVAQAMAARQTPGDRGRRLAALVPGRRIFCRAVVVEALREAHPSLDDVPDITETKTGIPGDPINVSLIGTEAELKRIMLAAKWYPADPLTLRSCLKIADASVLKRPYADAPVSNLYLFGRKEDLAFEQPVGPNPRQRHHVRFWHPEKTTPTAGPWIGSAVYDRRVGLSRTTGQITHLTAADIDAERDYLFHCLDRPATCPRPTRWTTSTRSARPQRRRRPLAYRRRPRRPGDVGEISMKDLSEGEAVGTRGSCPPLALWERVG